MDWESGNAWIHADKAPQGSLTWLMGMKFGGDGCVNCGDVAAGTHKRRHGANGVEGEVVYELPVCTLHKKKLDRRVKWSVIWMVLLLVVATAGLLILLLVDPQPGTKKWAVSEWLPVVIPCVLFFIAFLVVVTGEGRHCGMKVTFVDPANPLCHAHFNDPRRAYHAWKESFPEEADQYEQMQAGNWQPPPAAGGLPEGGWPGQA